MISTIDFSASSLKLNLAVGLTVRKVLALSKAAIPLRRLRRSNDSVTLATELYGRLLRLGNRHCRICNVLVSYRELSWSVLIPATSLRSPEIRSLILCSSDLCCRGLNVLFCVTLPSAHCFIASSSNSVNSSPFLLAADCSGTISNKRLLRWF